MPANPYIHVESIDASAGIVASRTFGTVPCFVQVSASGITAVGTDRPFEDLFYQWDFGDNSGETIADPVTGQPVSVNSEQTGPEAAYVYRMPGTYTITLTVTGQQADGTALALQVTQGIVVTLHQSKTVYYSPTGDNANDGLTPGTAKRSFTPIIEPNIVYSFECGGEYSLPHIPAWRDGWRFVSHGNGARPVLRCNGFDGLYCNVSNLLDVVFQNVELRQGTASHIVYLNAGEGSINHVYFDNCLITANPDRTVDSSLAFHLFRQVNGFGLWNCKIDMGNMFTSGEYLGSHQGAWRFMIGTEMANGVGAAIQKGRATTHNYYSGDEDHQLLRWCALGTEQTVDRLSNVKLNADYKPCRYIVVDECLLRGKWMFFGLGTNRTSHPEDVVISGNTMRDVSPNATEPRFGNSEYEVAWLKKGNHLTVRDNDIHVNRNVIAWVTGADGTTPFRPQIYRNGLLEGGTISAPNGYSRDNYVIGGPVPDPTPEPDPVPLPTPDPIPGPVPSGRELLLRLKLDDAGNVTGLQIVEGDN